MSAIEEPGADASAIAAAAVSTKAAGKPANKAKPAKAPGLRQTMSDLHIWTGLLAGWILYAVFLTGTLAFFRDEMSIYMRPEWPAVEAHAPQQAAAIVQRMLDQTLAKEPATQQVSITPPNARNPVVGVRYHSAQLAAQEAARGPQRGHQAPRGFVGGEYDPATGQPVQARQTRGGDFFYLFHFNLHYMPALWARWIVGLCAMFMLVAIISGVITHKKIFADFFTFRWGKGQRSWLDAHNALSVLGLPFHFMITWSGLVTLMLLYLPWSVDWAFPTPVERQQFAAQMRGGASMAVRPSGQAAPLASVQEMVLQAQQQWQVPHIGAVTVYHPGDANSKVLITMGEQGKLSTTQRALVFDGTTGQVVDRFDGGGAAAETRGVLYGLHLGRFADIVTRWLYFVVSWAGTAMVGTGLVLWTVKRRSRLPDPLQPHLGFRVVERLNIASIAGLSVAVAAYFWLNRLLPLATADRAATEINGFFLVWLGTLAWALVRPAKRAWVELLALAAVLLVLLPVANAVFTERDMLRSAWRGDWVFAGYELTLWVFAAAHAWLAYRTLRHQPKYKAKHKVKGSAKHGASSGAAAMQSKERGMA
ncbi:PepSY domain-containing protein [Lampropedia puyangensis]|uniref:PepSY domain-containing protein n=1 Tax=Lampropedia puyangensis TaxID=1330072 RepID=A0A4S8F5Q9_9BURK|nr:PepSY-associated TM helix domain-containing protein [Lampropedia puyangensis]THU01935.1 PepSY domain-containing protein [Lampropedia puyangensis]